MNISATRGLIAIKFYLMHHWGGGKAAIGFWSDWIRTLVSMATDSSHRVIMGKMLCVTTNLPSKYLVQSGHLPILNSLHWHSMGT